MLQTILIGSAMTVVNLGIQVWALALVISFFRRLLEREARMARSRKNIQVLAITMLVLLLGHFLQFSTWALLFLYLGVIVGLLGILIGDAL